MITVNERDLIDLMGNVDVSVLTDKIIEKDMKSSRRFFASGEGKKLFFLIPAILSIFTVLFVILARKKNH